LAGYKDFITNLTPGSAESSNGPVRSGILSSKATRSSLDASLNVNNAAPHSAAAQAGFESSQQQQQVTAPAFISKSLKCHLRLSRMCQRQSRLRKIPAHFRPSQAKVIQPVGDIR
jgi:hypothetical protein